MYSNKHNAVTLIIFPCLFVLMTVTLIYFTVMPVIRPYLNFATLFISNAPHETVQRDLFSTAASAPVYAVMPVSPGASQSDETEMTIPLSSITMPNPGDLYGRLTIEGTSVDAPVYWNDSVKELNAGIGTYTGGLLPGFSRTVMLAGHRDSWLRDLGSAQIGGIVTIETHYGPYEYKITDIAVYHMNDSSAYDFTRTDENLIIYTCYPFNFIGAAKQRYFVYAEPLSGLQVDWRS